MVLSICQMSIGLIQLILSILFFIRIRQKLYDKTDQIFLISTLILSFSSGIFILIGIINAIRSF
jgi:hypothetical protein